MLLVYVPSRMHHGRELMPGRKHNITEDNGVFKIVIFSVTDYETGMYTIIAKNKLGSVRSSAELLIQSKYTI